MVERRFPKREQEPIKEEIKAVKKNKPKKK
jgi:hypothetical protein